MRGLQRLNIAAKTQWTRAVPPKKRPGRSNRAVYLMKVRPLSAEKLPQSKSEKLSVSE